MKYGEGWTLFLDRDGVINVERPNDYVKNWVEFVWEQKSKEAISLLKPYFDRILVVTNQRGVGTGLMSEEVLIQIHTAMLIEISENGGRIDKIFYCTDVDRESYNRKPNPGMGHQAKSDYPEIDFNKAVMVGNTLSDMGFGRGLGMQTVFIDEKKKYNGIKTVVMDQIFDSLYEYAKIVSSKT